MSSEKMRYITARPLRYDIDRHVPVLEKVLSALPNNSRLTRSLEILGMTRGDEAFLYKMVARFVPMDYEV